MTYKQFAVRFGLPDNYVPSWANRNTLDQAAQESRADPWTGNLDLTFLIRSSSSHYPSVISGQPFDKKNPGPQMKTAREEAQRIIDRFAPGTPNPY